MREKQTSTTVAKPSIEAFALPSELRRTHNFASRARPIIGLDLPSTPPPLGAGEASAPIPFRRQPPRAARLSDTDFSIAPPLGDADPPFNPPALWREPQPASPARRRPHWSERSTAGFVGFAAGLLIVVPLVFVIGANPGGPVSSRAASLDLPSPAALLEKVRASEIVQALAPRPLGASGHSAAEAGRSAPPADTATNTTLTVPGATDPGATDAAAGRALTALADGRVEEARSLLRAAATPETPRLWFLLAETYDPNVAPPGPAPASRDPADVEFARFYYRQSLTYGHEPARARLDALLRP